MFIYHLDGVWLVHSAIYAIEELELSVQLLAVPVADLELVALSGAGLPDGAVHQHATLLRVEVVGPCLSSLV